MVPENEVVVPRVAEDPTLQNTLHGWVPLVRRTLAPLTRVRVLPISKMKIEPGLPSPSSVTVAPVATIADADVKHVTPG
jgi:hypothetical protein